jgi:hypothetical protein
MMLLLLGLAPGCRKLLDIPGDPTAVDGGTDDGADDDDGDDDGDGGGECRPVTSLSNGFDERDAIAGWELDLADGCDIEVVSGRLLLRQLGSPGRCRAFAELSLDISNQGLLINTVDANDEQVSIVFSLVLSDGVGDIRSRRRIRIERDDGELRMGQCVDDLCEETVFGTIPFDDSDHVWWGIVHDALDDSLYFEFADEEETFSRSEALPVTDITPDLIRCVGVELGSYETSDSGAAGIGDLLASPTGAGG